MFNVGEWFSLTPLLFWKREKKKSVEKEGGGKRAKNQGRKEWEELSMWHDHRQSLLLFSSNLFFLTFSFSSLSVCLSVSLSLSLSSVRNSLFYHQTFLSIVLVKEKGGRFANTIKEWGRIFCVVNWFKRRKKTGQGHYEEKEVGERRNDCLTFFIHSSSNHRSSSFIKKRRKREREREERQERKRKDRKEGKMFVIQRRFSSLFSHSQISDSDLLDLLPPKTVLFLSLSLSSLLFLFPTRIKVISFPSSLFLLWNESSGPKLMNDLLDQPLNCFSPLFPEIYCSYSLPLFQSGRSVLSPSIKCEQKKERKR